MRGFMITVGALCLLGVPTTLGAQETPDPDYVLEISRATGDIGDTAVVTITYSSTGEDIVAYEWGMCHDEDVISITADDIVNGATVDDAGFFFHSIVMADGGWKVAGVLDNFLGAENVIEAGNNLLMYTCTYSLDAGGKSDLEFCDTVVDPPPNIAVYVDDDQILPTTINGKIDVFDPDSPFFYTAETLLVTYDSKVGEAIFDVTLSIEENSGNSGFPQSARGFGMGLAHDDTVLTVNDVNPLSAIDDLNGGEGPDFWGPNLEPRLGAGITIGVIVSFGGDDAVTFEGQTDVATVEYEADSDLLADNEDGLITELLWDDGLGSEATTNNVWIGDEVIQGTRLVDGLIEFSSGGVLFKRGDANGDGDVSGLTDGLFLLNYQFTEGPTPPCFDAADANGDNAVTGLVDGLFILKWHFSEGAPPPSPGPNECGPDDDNDTEIECEVPPEGCN